MDLHYHFELILIGFLNFHYFMCVYVMEITFNATPYIIYWGKYHVNYHRHSRDRQISPR